jgi:hypothetical protein
MTGREPALTLRAPEDRALRNRLYRALAQELAAAPGPAAVVFESSTGTGQRPPELTLRPFELFGATFAAPAFRALGAELADLVGSLALEPGRPATTWVIAPTEGSPSVSVPPGAWDVPEALALLGPTGRLDFQTFWLSGRSDGRLWVGRRVRFGTTSAEELELHGSSVASFAAAEWSRATGVLCRAGPARRPSSDWAMAASRSLPRAAWLAVPASRADLTAEPVPLGAPEAPTEDGHTIALGASGAGKTTFLADRASRAIRQGWAVLAVDLHGDLAPAIVGRLPREDRERVVAVDVDRRPVVGVAALAGRSDRAAAQFVAAVKRLSPDGSDVYWGFRLERIFDAFVRLVQESGGTLGDLYALLTDVDRREAARLSTRVPELARFLDELGPIVRRTPEFLWAAAARLAKVVLIPELAELLAPADDGVPVEELLDEGRSLLVRIPFASVGPEAAAFAGSLVLARSYLGLAARRGPVGSHDPIVVVLDEVQGLSPRLVAEMLTEGRKFGLRLALASQYPERLAPELRLAAAGVSRSVVAFRVPHASASEVGSWLGLAPIDAQRILPELPVGLGVARVPGSGELRSVPAGGSGPSSADRAWAEATARTLDEFPATPAVDSADLDAATERLLLAVLASDEQGSPVAAGRLVDEARGIPGPPLDRAVLDDRAGSLERGGLAHEVAGAWHLTPAGERRLGLRTVTGASKESAEHRALLLRTFRLFARHGHRLEIVRQGRFDTTLPDALLRQIPDRCRSGSPRELAGAIASAERTWAWRLFGGRDVHVEAEVSGALRPARVRHGLEKARSRGAFPLFVVGDATRASRIRRTLRAEGLGPGQAQVWTLHGPNDTGGRAGYPDGKLPERSAPP